MGYGQSSEQSIRKKVVEVAESQLHVRELTGNNDGVEIENYLSFVNLNPKGKFAYCAAFASFVYYQAGVNTIVSGWSPDFYYKGKIKYTKGKTLQKVDDIALDGDALTYWNNSLGRIGHVDIKATGNLPIIKGHTYTIGGNTKPSNTIIREGISGDTGQGVHRKIIPNTIIYGVTDHINKK